VAKIRQSIVNALPDEANRHPHSVYFVKSSSADRCRVYVTGATAAEVREIGEQPTPDLSGYYLKTESDALLDDKLSKTGNGVITGNLTVGVGTQDSDPNLTLTTKNYVVNKAKGVYDSTSNTFVPSSEIRAYFESKNGLVTNGSGFLKTNYNWSGGNKLTYSGADVAQLGQPGCFVYTGPRYTANVVSSETIPVNPFASYKCAMSAKGTDTGRCYGYIRCFDIDNKSIAPYYTMRINQPNAAGGLKLTLTQDVVDGDTVMHFDDLSGMANDSGKGYRRRLVKGGYTNSQGDTYEFYSRLTNVGHANWASYSDIDKVNNTITLSAPVDASTYYLRGVVGDQYWQGSSAGSYKYIFMSGVLMVPGGPWISRSANTTGMDSAGSWITSKFAEGTAFVKVGVLLGWGGSATVDATYKFTGFSMEKIV